MKKPTILYRGIAMAVLVGLAGIAPASDKSHAREAIIEADASVQAAWAAGAGDAAPVIQSRATTALDRARWQLRKSHEHRAYYAAREADAYARLALATAQQHGR
jgi:hypothetical protein